MGATTKTIDMSNVKEGGNFNKHRVPEGDYKAKILKVEDAESKADKGFQYLFTIQLDKFSSYKYPYYCKLVDNQLWKLRNLLVAAGKNVPKKRMKLDPNTVVGKWIGVTMEDDEYDGKMQSNIAAVFPVSELAEGSFDEADADADADEVADTDIAVDDDDTGEEPAKKKGKKEKDKKGKKKGKVTEGDMEELDLEDL